MTRTNGMTWARLLAPLLAVALAACSEGGADDDDGGGGPQIPFPAAEGIRQNLSRSALEAGGWTVCHDSSYTEEALSIPGILEGCEGEYLMLACASGTSGDLLSLAAADTRAIVTQADAATPTAHHAENGVGWYYTEGFSWGFFPAGEAVSRNPCDGAAGETSPDKRLCWHLISDELSDGYRCGSQLNPPSSWRRLVLAHP